MNVTPEELAAFADGELDPARACIVEAEVARSADLQAELAAHRALKSRLAAHFAPIAEQSVPDSLTRLLQELPPADTADNVIDLAAARRHRSPAASPWLWRYVGPALAASLVLAVIGLSLRPSADQASGDLALALDTQLAVSQTRADPVRILLSFRDHDGAICRGYADNASSGIACRADRGWKIVHRFGGAAARTDDYRQAGSGAEQVFVAAQEMASGAPLDESEERAARSSHWLDH